MLYLASRSPRRRQLLEQLGVGFRVLDVDVPECPGVGESPCDYVHRVAREKARAGLASVADAADAVVLAGDTEVVLDDVIFGKPADAAAATAMLRRLSGRVHEVVSVVCVLARDHEECARSVSKVTFDTLDTVTLAALLDAGEYLGKAGGYAIQGRAAACVSRIEGSYSGVMGLPLHETARLLRGVGLWPARRIDKPHRLPL